MTGEKQGQEGGHDRDVLRLSGATQPHRSNAPPFRFLAGQALRYVPLDQQGTLPVGHGHARTYNIDIHIVCEAHLRPRLGCVLECRIDRPAENNIRSRSLTKIARDIDDSAPRLFEKRPQPSDQAQCPIELELEPRLPILFLQFEDRAALGGARIVDEDIESTRRRAQPAGHRFDAADLRQIGHTNLDRATGHCSDLVCRGTQVGFGSRDQQQVAPFRRQAFGDGSPDATTGPGDQSPFSREFQIHDDRFARGTLRQPLHLWIVGGRYLDSRREGDPT